MNFTEDVIQKFAFSKEAIIEIDADGGRHVHHFSELFARALGLTGALAELGLGRGDVVAIATGQRAEQAIAMLACMRMGAVAMLADPALGRDRLRELIALAGAGAVIAARDDLDAGIGRDLPGFGFDDLARIFDEDLPQATPSAAVDLDPAEPALVCFEEDADGNHTPVTRSQAWLQDECARTAAALGAKDGDLVWWMSGLGNGAQAAVPAWLAGAKALFTTNTGMAPLEILELALATHDILTEEGSATTVVCLDDDQQYLFPEAGSRRLDTRLRLVGSPAIPPACL